MRVIAFLVGLATVALLAGPAAAFYDETLEIEFVESSAYFTPTTTGLGNIDQQLGEKVGWSAEEPTGQSGQTIATSHAGLTSIVSESTYETQSFLAEGTVTGYLENIRTQLYYRSPTQNLCGMSLSFDVTVDGEKVLDMEGVGHTTDVTSYASENDYYVAEFAFVDLYEAMLDRGIEGDETTEHTIAIVAQMYPLCQEAIWTYGSAEAPSGLTFNVDPDSGAYRRLTKFDVNNPPAPPAQ